MKAPERGERKRTSVEIIDEYLSPLNRGLSGKIFFMPTADAVGYNLSPLNRGFNIGSPND